MTNWTERLLEAIDRLTSHGDYSTDLGHKLILAVDVDELERLAAEARTALAQPEPEGPTEHDIAELAEDIQWKQLPQDEATRPSFLLEFARAVLTRYARPTIKPVPVAERLPVPGAEDGQP
jgi:hypothetical protein